MAPFDLAPDPSGFSRAPSDAAGVGRREAFGVRQLAAALLLCTNNVSVPSTIQGLKARPIASPSASSAYLVVENLNLYTQKLRPPKPRISTGFQPLLSLIWPTYLGRCPRLV
ncbi:MAG: hypothetical protein GX456_19130 [Verrucomicrobia bacterium]|nr:hypothetical protein [Verrucomicrobiota bacterium]